MNNTQKIAVGGIVLVVLGGIAFTMGKKDQQSFASKDSKKTELPEIKGSDDLDKLVLTNGEKGEITLEKKGDKWAVTKPVEAPANQSNVKSLLDNLKDLKVSEQVEPNATDDVKKTYQLDGPKAVHVVAFKGGEKKVDDLFGKNGGRGQVVIADGKPGVYIATGYSSYLYTRELKNWRETEVFKFDDANVTSMTIEKKTGAFSFTKGGDHWAGTFKGQPIADFDEEKVKEALRTYKNLNADDFGDGKSAAETGLDSPESTVTIALKDGAGKYVLHVGKPVGALRYAQKDGDPTIVEVSSSAGDWATAEPTKFEKAKDAGAAAGKDAGTKTAAK